MSCFVFGRRLCNVDLSAAEELDVASESVDFTLGEVEQNGTVYSMQYPGCSA